MKNANLKDYPFIMNGEIKLDLLVEKRNEPLSLRSRKDDVSYEDAERFLDAVHYFHNIFVTRFVVRIGYVMIANFYRTCGAEIRSPHFVVAITNSSKKNPMVTIVPLKSYKPGKPLNPASDINLGVIPGIMNGQESIAVINQIHSIDKSRFFNPKVLRNAKSIFGENKVENNDECLLQKANVYRLNDDQVAKLTKAVREFINYGFIKHK